MLVNTKRFQIIARSLARKLRHSPERTAKQRLVRDYARQADLHVLIETGTYLGDLIEATKGDFREIHSIELDPELYGWAKWRFRRFPHVHLHCGDSAVMLPIILTAVQQPCLFWLDAHDSGGITATNRTVTPIVTELRAIMSHDIAGHLILIDDADSFTGVGAYPSLADIRRIAHGWSVESKNGVIRIMPPRLAKVPGGECHDEKFETRR